MSTARSVRGDGIGLELTSAVVRGVRLAHDVPTRIAAAAEVAVHDPDDDRRVLDSLVRLRSELGSADHPTRIALFPAGATLQRIDVTGRSGAELNGLRRNLEERWGIGSSVLLDAGPHRWLLPLSWDAAAVRRIEELAERAGYVDVAIDPAPVALLRVLPTTIAFACRDAAPGESFAVAVDREVPIAAVCLDLVGREPPGLELGSEPVTPGWIDELVDPDELRRRLERLQERQQLHSVDDAKTSLRLVDQTLATHPAHDVRAPARLAVALGAAVGAAGLAGRLRPVDVIVAPSSPDLSTHPWAIEAVSPLAPTPDAPRVGPLRRALALVLPRRTPRPR